jgi:ATP-dependent DNA ligase
LVPSALAGRARVVVYGELVCLDPATGRPSFERFMAWLQAILPAVAARQAPVTFTAFDVLAVDGVDVCRRPRGSSAGNSSRRFLAFVAREASN